jgi:hypothetical protein
MISPRNGTSHTLLDAKVKVSMSVHVEPDLGRAALLHTLGYSFLGLHDLGNGRLGFAFRDDRGSAPQDAETYYEARVLAHDIVESLRILKRALSLEKENGKHEHYNDTPSRPE